MVKRGGYRNSVDREAARAAAVAAAAAVEEAEEEREEQEEEAEVGQVEADADASGSTSGTEEGQEVEYTVKDRQDAINIEHPFGLPIWKPALYKKSRSVTRNAESALHSIPSAAAERHLLPGNLLWTLLFGWWLALLTFVVSALLSAVPDGGSRAAHLVFGLGWYLFWPFGKYVEKELSEEDAARRLEREEGRDAGAHDDASAPWTPGTARWSSDVSETLDETEEEDEEEEEGGLGRVRTLRPGDIPGAHAAAAERPTSSASAARQQRSDRAEGGSGLPLGGERAPLLSHLGKGRPRVENGYGAMNAPGSEDGGLGREGEDGSVHIGLGGRIAFFLVFWLILAPAMGIVCLLCWGGVFTIPMAKLNWVLLKHLAKDPFLLHFRAAPRAPETSAEDGGGKQHRFLRLRPGQLAPRMRTSSFMSTPGKGRHRQSTILLCTYRAVGLQYYKYTVGGVNILFVDLLPIIFFVIFDAFVLEPYVHRHHSGGLLKAITSQAVIFVLALASVIPLSYFIGMAVASISAQSSIGMGAVINATFGSVIEVILYGIALKQGKGRLVEGSIVGSLLAGVLLMPGLSMVSGATRRKEQRFNAKSAGVTSTMLIMAIVGILTPTLFYQIYGTFQLTCQGCPTEVPPSPTSAWTCKRCFYEHVNPATDPFYQKDVKGLMYFCAVILVLSYLVGLWFSLRTHASQIWQSPQPMTAHDVTGGAQQNLPAAQRASIYKRLLPTNVVNQLLPTHRHSASGTGLTPTSAGNVTQPLPSAAPAGTPQQQPSAGGQGGGTTTSSGGGRPPSLQLPENVSAEDFHRVVALTASAFRSVLQQHHHQAPGSAAVRASLHEHEEEAHGGHDAPSWSRITSASVLLACTFLYAVIAEILVDVVDVVLKGSGIDEKLLGITLFALVPNTTEFMNAMSFAMNGNIALSMEIGSAYALQVCLLQIPAMVAFSAVYGASGRKEMLNYTFTLIFPRWDVIAIIFSVFLLTYTYIESRSNYYRGSILIFSYLVLGAGFFFAPSNGDEEYPGDHQLSFPPSSNFGLSSTAAAVLPALGVLGEAKAWLLSLWAR